MGLQPPKAGRTDCIWGGDAILLSYPEASCRGEGSTSDRTAAPLGPDGPKIRGGLEIWLPGSEAEASHAAGDDPQAGLIGVGWS